MNPNEIYYIEPQSRLRNEYLSWIVFPILMIIFVLGSTLIPYLLFWGVGLPSLLIIDGIILIPILIFFIIWNGLFGYQKFSITDEGIYPPKKLVFPLGQKNLIMKNDVLRIEIIVMKNNIEGLDIITTNGLHCCIYTVTGVGSLIQIVRVLKEQRYPIIWREYLARRTFKDLPPEISEKILQA